jgi:hypothetical protein
MIKLDRSHKLTNYENITNDNCPSFSGIVAGECKGDLWVDDLDNPRISIVYSYPVGSFAFLGSTINDNEYIELKKYIEKEIFNFLRQEGVSYFEFSIESEDLKPYILKIFEDKAIQSEREFSYRKAEHVNSSYSLPEDFEIQKINNDFLNKVFKGDYDNKALLVNRILESWQNIDDFSDRSLAFCITYLKRIVAVIVGTARYKNLLAIDIETEEEFKHKGLGYCLTVEFVNECMKRGLIAQWDCMESNLASRKLAEKAGFKAFKENDVYWFDMR